MGKSMQKKFIKRSIQWIGLFLAVIFIYLALKYFHVEQFWENTKEFFLENPSLILIVTLAYSLSFLLRAEAWRIYLGKSVRFFSCLEGVLLSLFINHLTPIKLGDVIRIGVMTWREKNISPEISTHSVAVLRVLDMGILLIFSFIGLLVFSEEFFMRYSISILLIIILIGSIGILFLYKFRRAFLLKHIALLKSAFSGKNFLLIFSLVSISWILEGMVVWGVSASAGLHLSFFKAVWVNSITVGGQIFQITPGGISTYETVMITALTSFQYSVKDGLMVALVSHSYKFIFSYLAGLFLLIHSPVEKINKLKTLLRLRGEQK